ncbi:MAG: GTP cyclohydrolase I FolE [bacterium (Candidatus Stahlbacteria) CG23_combo_of_CG06-09_8_20_14_all_40_9]|nr:MAG: GTP cyclohydrolase I FolE [bacterium (Candidatus Stahlbacteria) CG23_combo_of_CG06-09_8_20_14_all_40_9]
MSMINKKLIEKSVRDFLVAIGENPDREGLKDTPKRIAKMAEEIFGGVGVDPKGELRCYTMKNEDEMILIRDIPFYSMCEHHLLPFIGKVHLAYIPNENRVTGYSSLVRLVEVMAKRPQLQERLTTDIAEVIMETLNPKGILIVIEAEHLCMSMRGVKKPGHIAVTSAMRGIMRQAATRAEAFSLIKNVR